MDDPAQELTHHPASDGQPDQADARIAHHLHSTLGPVRRRQQGAFYTPLPLARSVVRAALAEGQFPAGRPLTVLDPTVGSGDFLVAAQLELEQVGIASRLVGADIDVGALAIARSRLGDAVDLCSGDSLEPGLLGEQTFDLVIGNPPYGLKRSDACNWGLPGSRIDSYAAFLAMGLGRLAPGGVLGFVVADTWLTLRSHRVLRRQILEHLVAVLRLPPEAFPATVSTAVVLARRSHSPRDACGAANDLQRPGPVRMADLTDQPVSRLPEAIASALAPGPTALQGVYEVARSVFATIPSTPLFVGDPTMADLLQEGPTSLERISLGPRASEVHVTAPVCHLRRNDRDIRIVRLGDLAEVRHGLSTGANARYVRVRQGHLGRYQEVDPRKIASPERLARITDADREHGLTDTEAPFVPLDKGMPSDSAGAWLPNYHVPTPYFIDWSRSALADMRRNPGFSWKNWRYFFKPGLTFSVSGAYAPTFRLNASGVFEAKGSCLFSSLDPELLLGILCSRPARYFFKVFLKHTVDTSGADVAAFPLVIPTASQAAEICSLVAAIVAQQRKNARHDYLRCEQVRLDALIADCYALSEAERSAIDTWFARRYGRLDEAIRSLR